MAIDRAVKANVSIYPVDTRGLTAIVPGGSASQASGRGGASMFSGRGVSRQFDSQTASQDTLVALASDTGGKAFLDTNDFGGVYTKVIADTSAYYLIGYSSTNPGTRRTLQADQGDGSTSPVLRWSTATATTPLAISSTPARRIASSSCRTS